MKRRSLLIIALVLLAVFLLNFRNYSLIPYFLKNHNSSIIEKTAYVFYATNKQYFCYSLVLAKNLISYTNSSNRDFILLYSINSSEDIKKFEDLSPRAKVIQIKIITGRRGMWTSSFTRFHAWSLTQFDKILILDSDMYAFRSFEKIFDIDLPNDGSVIAAPKAYWLPRNVFTSICMLVRPNLTIFEQLKTLSKNASLGFDMDILNIFFNKSVVDIGLEYAALDGEWMPKENMFEILKNQSISPALMHFSKSGKPSSKTCKQLKRKRKKWGRFVVGVYTKWCSDKKRLCDGDLRPGNFTEEKLTT